MAPLSAPSTGEEKWYASIRELMDAVDSYIPTPERDNEKPFLMAVEDVMTISGRGTVATGRVERGELKLNDPVEIVGIKETQSSVANRHRDVPQDPGLLRGWRQRRYPAPWYQA